MSKTLEAIVYIVLRYPHEDELSNARLTKMVYLADWKHALSHGQQITPIEWYFNNFGPFVWDVLEEARSDPDRLEVVDSLNMHGSSKTLIRACVNEAEVDLSPKETASLDTVIDECQSLYWNGFIAHVYNTAPIRMSRRYSKLDLARLSQEVKPRRSRTL